MIYRNRQKEYNRINQKRIRSDARKERLCEKCGMIYKGGKASRHYRIGCPKRKMINYKYKKCETCKTKMKVGRNYYLHQEACKKAWEELNEKK